MADTKQTLGAIPAPDKVNNKTFLEGVFSDAWEGAHVTGFTADPTDATPDDWMGAPWRAFNADWLTRLPKMNGYFTVSRFTGNRRTKADFAMCHAIVLDDVGTKVAARDALRAMGDPSWRLETSQGNEQWGYVLDPPVGDRGTVEAVLRALGGLGLTDPGTVDATRYMRLPVGLNTKGGAARPVVLREWRPDRRFAVGDLMGRAGVDPGDTMAANVRPAAEDMDFIIARMMEWNELTGTRTGDGGWHLRVCPWDAEHTKGAKAEDRTAVWAGGNFKCFHGHCAHRGRPEFRAWFDARLEEESGGLITNSAQWDSQLDRIDPKDVHVPEPDPRARPAASPGTGTGAKTGGPSAAERFLGEMVFVVAEVKWFSLRTQELFTDKALDMHFRTQLDDVLRLQDSRGREIELKVADWWSQQPARLRASRMTYWPGREPLITENRAVLVNLWRPSLLGAALAKGPAIADDAVRPWLNIVDHVLGNEGPEFVARVLDWAAHVVAEPGVKPGWHLLVHGAQGIGKDMLMAPVVAAVGAGNVGRVSAAGLHRDYNPWAEKRLVLVSELKQTSVGSQSGRDQYHTLKDLTENTSETISINQKYRQMYEARNVGAFYVTSNESDALALDADDRRFVVAASTAVKLGQDYYAGLLGWLRGPGTELVAGWLRQRHASLSAARRAALLGHAVANDSKRQMVLEADPVGAWMHEQIEDRVWPDLMTGADIQAAVVDAVRKGALRYPVSPQRWGKLLREFGGVKVYAGAPVRLPDGQRARVWAVRGGERFTGMGEAQVATAYKSKATRDFEHNADVVDFSKTNAGVGDGEENATPRTEAKGEGVPEKE